MAAAGRYGRHGAVLPSAKAGILANTAEWQTLLAHTFELIVNRALIACPEDRNLTLDDTSCGVSLAFEGFFRRRFSLFC